MSAVHTLLGQDRPGPKFQPLPVSILKCRSGCGFFRCVPTRRLKGSRQHSNWRPFTRPTLAQCINLTQKMFPRQPVTHKHLPQAIETSAMCVCVLVLLCVRCLAEQVHCSPTSTVNLALTLEQPGHVASPLSDGTANTQLSHLQRRSCWWTHGLAAVGLSYFNYFVSLFLSFLHLTWLHNALPARVFFFFQLLLKSPHRCA